MIQKKKFSEVLLNVPTKERLAYVTGVDPKGMSAKKPAGFFIDKKTIKLPYKVGTWSKILRIKEYASFLITIEFSQTAQASIFTYIVNTGYSYAKINQIGFNGYPSNSNIPIRITKVDNNPMIFDLEVKGIFKSPSENEIFIKYTFFSLAGGSFEPYTSFVEGSGDVAHEIVSKPNPD